MDLANALIADLQKLLEKPAQIANLADLRAAAPTAVAEALRVTSADTRKKIAAIEREQQTRRETIDKAVANDAARRVARLKESDARPAPAPRAGVFVVSGRVTDKKSGAGLPNVTIHVFDLDRKKDDLLGMTRTDDQGYYQFEYIQPQVDDKRDRQAEIYLQILDDSGAVIYQTPRSFFDKAGPVYELDAAVDGAKLPAHLALAEAVKLRRETEIARYMAASKPLLSKS